MIAHLDDFQPFGAGLALRARKRIDHDAVLSLWRDGYSSAQIAERLGLASGSTARTVTTRARKRGDPRAILRRTFCPWPRKIELPREIADLGRVEAERRGLTVSDFCLRLLETIFRDGLVTAVLDDEPSHPGD
jgi:hypothetical protein